MIQRIQTLYLLLAAAAVSLMFVYPFALFATVGNELLQVAFNGIKYVGDAQASVDYVARFTVFPALLGIILIGLLVTIFLYKKRMLQLRISTILLVLIVFFYGVIVYYLYVMLSPESTITYTLKPVLAMPFIAGVFIYLAIRAIGRDEALIRSLDRLR